MDGMPQSVYTRRAICRMWSRLRSLLGSAPHRGYPRSYRAGYRGRGPADAAWYGRSRNSCGRCGRSTDLMQFVVGNGMEHLGVCPAAVVAVDDLAHQPELRLHLVGNAAQAPHEVEVQHVGSVQTDASISNSSPQEADGVRNGSSAPRGCGWFSLTSRLKPPQLP